MKKVLIVEDEILARLGLRQLVDWRKLELELLRMQQMEKRHWK